MPRVPWPAPPPTAPSRSALITPPPPHRRSTSTTAPPKLAVLLLSCMRPSALSYTRNSSSQRLPPPPPPASPGATSPFHCRHSHSSPALLASCSASSSGLVVRPPQALRLLPLASQPAKQPPIGVGKHRQAGRPMRPGQPTEPGQLWASRLPGRVDGRHPVPECCQRGARPEHRAGGSSST